MSDLKPSVRLDYVSPLPPVRSGIADYSLDLLPPLADLCDLRVLSLPGQSVADEVRLRWRPVPIDDAFAEPDDPSSSRRLPLYQMGNNRFHEAVGRAAMGRPGVLTLHDLVLHHLHSELTLGVRDFAAYTERVEQDHGWIGKAVAGPRLWGGDVIAGLFALPVHRTLLRRQRGVLVHSTWARDLLLEDDPELRVRAVPMGIPLPPAVDREQGAEFRRRYGIPLDRPLLGSFGFQTPIKRTDRVIAALARPELSQVHLLIGGESSPGNDLVEQARQAGVAERVHAVGFLPFDEFESAIAATDLCLNLRYPTAGETSASLLRVLAVGRGCLVSDYAQFAELPDEIVVKVPLGDHELEAIGSRLASLLAEPGRLRTLGDAAREHVRREHDPQRAAAAVVDACAEWAECEPLAEAAVEIPAPSSRTWSHLAGRLEVLDWPRKRAAWPPGARRRLTVALHNDGPARWLAAGKGAGGIALAVRIRPLSGSETADWEGSRPWLALENDLEPGQTATFEIEIRKPLRPACLSLVPQVVGGSDLGTLGGPVWESEL